MNSMNISKPVFVLFCFGMNILMGIWLSSAIKVIPTLYEKRLQLIYLLV